MGCGASYVIQGLINIESWWVYLSVDGVKKRRLPKYRLSWLVPIWDKQGIIPCTKHPKRGEEETVSCHLGLMLFIIRRVNLLETMIDGRYRITHNRWPKKGNGGWASLPWVNTSYDGQVRRHDTKRWIVLLPMTTKERQMLFRPRHYLDDSSEWVDNVILASWMPIRIRMSV